MDPVKVNAAKDRVAAYLMSLASVPSTLYHATYKPVLASIMKHGLDATKATAKNWSDSKDGVIYLSNNASVAESYAETSEDIPDESWLDQIVVLQIDAQKLNQNKFSADRNVIEGDATFEYHGIIPPNVIKIVKK
jgi:RNA:NAD 2'-phosphotransferase (TPT1/KptA family)